MGKTKKHDSKTKSRVKRKEKKKKSKKHKISKDKRKHEQKKINDEKVAAINDDFSIPVELMNNKSHAPETPEEYKQRQNRIHRDIDPVTGRSRLIKGDGEIMEEIVSKERHRAINREATRGDGNFYQQNTLGKL